MLTPPFGMLDIASRRGLSGAAAGHSEGLKKEVDGYAPRATLRALPTGCCRREGRNADPAENEG